MRSRRKFIRQSALISAASIWGVPIVFSKNITAGLPLVGSFLEATTLPEGKNPELTLLNDKPWNIETPAHLLHDKITPKDKIFVRNNGLLPTKIDTQRWALTIAGESVKAPKTYTLEELKRNFPHHTYQITLECGGNGRAEFNPPTPGNQWTTGAVYASAWTGVRLRDVLKDVGVLPNAVYIGYYGKDVHLNGDPNKVVISRGVPIHKAMEEETLLAFQMNGEDIPLIHGFPLRLVVGGYPASVSGKWLHKIVVRDQIHDGPKMMGDAYRVPCEAVSPGATVPDDEMCIIASMPVKSLITSPKTGAVLTKSRQLEVGGHAWAGDFSVERVEVSIDFGATWQAAALAPPVNRFAWQHWQAKISFPQKGYYEIWAKATDSQGISQPMVVPGWNPKGYLNNACHRIAVKVSI